MTAFFKFKSKKLSSVHIVGIGGIGVSRLAFYYLSQGLKISGSDLINNELTVKLRKLGVGIALGHNASNVPKQCDLLVYSAAIGDDNPERQAASDRSIRQLQHFEAIQEIADGKHIIAVCGTNGKSTTTALIGLMLEEAGLDPTVFVGSLVPEWDGNVRVGAGKYFVVEADELNRQFLSLKPRGVVITNIELDHLDYFKDLRDIRDAYRQFIESVTQFGFIVFNHDDAVTMDIMQNLRYPNMTGYGQQGRALRLVQRFVTAGQQHVTVSFHGKEEKFNLLVPGEHNVYNALAAWGAAAFAEVPTTSIRKTLEEYRGIWRRFQVLGNTGNTLVVSDYAHHPTSVVATVKGTRDFYPGKKILLVFQPHQRRRTALLFDEFASALTQAQPDGLILVEIFDVPGREGQAASDVTSRDLMTAVSRRLERVDYAHDLDSAEQKIRAQLDSYDIVIVMGAGDIYHVAENLVHGRA